MMVEVGLIAGAAGCCVRAPATQGAQLAFASSQPIVRPTYLLLTLTKMRATALTVSLTAHTT